MAFRFGMTSEARLAGVHPDLVRVLRRYLLIGEIDIAVTEGVRTPARQQALFAAGASSTLDSRHLTGHAVDLCAWIAGAPDYSWPAIRRIAVGMKKAASLEAVPIEWGGDWRTFKDGPHWQLPWGAYPSNRKGPPDLPSGPVASS